MKLILRFKKMPRWYKVVLYHDPLWTYVGEDRAQILSDRLDAILVETPVKNNFSDELIKDTSKMDRIYSLEKRIKDLEDELDDRNLIIREQMNVILNLANSIRNTIFDGIQYLYPLF